MVGEIQRPLELGARLAPERLTLDVDATLITAHSEKEKAAGNYKGGYGFHPLQVLNETRERSAACSGRGTPAPTPPMIMWRSWALSLGSCPKGQSRRADPRTLPLHDAEPAADDPGGDCFRHCSMGGAARARSRSSAPPGSGSSRRGRAPGTRGLDLERALSRTVGAWPVSHDRRRGSGLWTERPRPAVLRAGGAARSGRSQRGRPSPLSRGGPRSHPVSQQAADDGHADPGGPPLHGAHEAGRGHE